MSYSVLLSIHHFCIRTLLYLSPVSAVAALVVAFRANWWSGAAITIALDLAVFAYAAWQLSRCEDLPVAGVVADRRVACEINYIGGDGKCYVYDNTGRLTCLTQRVGE